MSNNLDNIEKQKKFVEIFKKDVSPYLKGYEVLRKRLYKEVIVKKTIPNSFFFIIYIGCLAHIAFSQHIALAIIIFFFTLPFVATFVTNFNSKINEKINTYRLNLKKEFLIKIIKAFGDIKWTDKAKIFDESEIFKSGLFAGVNLENIDDGFLGKYKGVDFKVCETKMLDFKGVILEFNHNKKAETRTVVSSKRDSTGRDGIKMGIVIFGIFLTVFLFGFLEYFFNISSFFNIIPEMFESIKKTEHFTMISICICGVVAILSVVLIMFGFSIYIFISGIKAYFKELKKQEQIVLEDVKFGKKYHVYSDNQIEARYFLTPTFMEKFLNLEVAFESQKAKCSFYDNKIMLAISTNKNLFEIGYLNKSLLEPKNFKNLFNEMNAIYDIIEYFNLDKKQ